MVFFVLQDHDHNQIELDRRYLHIIAETKNHHGVGRKESRIVTSQLKMCKLEDMRSELQKNIYKRYSYKYVFCFDDKNPG
jgi:hypothetical protein